MVKSESPGELTLDEQEHTARLAMMIIINPITVSPIADFLCMAHFSSFF